MNSNQKRVYDKIKKAIDEADADRRVITPELIEVYQEVIGDLETRIDAMQDDIERNQ